MYKRTVNIGRAIIIFDKLTCKSHYSLREWLNIDKLLRRQKVWCNK